MNDRFAIGLGDLNYLNLLKTRTEIWDHTPTITRCKQFSLKSQVTDYRKEALRKRDVQFTHRE